MPMAELKEGGVAEMKKLQIMPWAPSNQDVQGGDCDENHRFSSTGYVFGCNHVGCGNLPDIRKFCWWFGVWQFIGGL